VNVYQVTEAGLTRADPGGLKELLRTDGGFVWVDVPLCQSPEVDLLRDVFGFHELALRDCVTRNHVAKIHAYADHVFTVLHAPEIGRRGHVHYIELDQFLGRNYLVTVHGPLNPSVDAVVAHIDTGHVLARMQSRSFRPTSPFELSSAIVQAMSEREVDLVASLAEQSGWLEQQVVLSGDVGENKQGTEEFLGQLFRVWYELLAIRTIAVHSSATYARMARMAKFLPPEDTPIVADLADGFDMVASMADGQREFLHGVVEHFQTRISTHLTISADDMAQTSVRQNDDMRKIFAWVAIVAVPTAVTGFFGQNVPYPGFGTAAGFIASCLIMASLAVLLYAVFRRRRWL